MTSYFTNGFFFRRNNKKVAKVARDGEEESSYPKAKKAKRTSTDTSPFDGATPADTGSWLISQDMQGIPYWWNDVTGQWTYQLYSNYEYPMHHQMMPSLMYPHQQQASPHDQYNMMSGYQPWLVSPSGGASVHRDHRTPWNASLAGSTAAAAASTAGMSWTNYVQDDGDESDEEEEEAIGTWEKFYNSVGRPIWIHSITGERKTVDPTA